jgi:hypothetical protein
VLALSIVLLLIAFRSLLIPVQAAMTNLLCVGAAFGVLVATFQWGWGLDLVGLSTPYGTVPIASYVPLMMFAALFGLSMDYEVFLVSQIAQHHAAGEPPRQAVRSGLASSAKVIAAAAIIMISVFGSFILNGDPTIKQFGVGLSVAVLLASAMVLSLAPAMLTLFGRAVWWLPRWLSTLLPHVDIEGEAEPTTQEPAAVPNARARPPAAHRRMERAMPTGDSPTRPCPQPTPGPSPPPRSTSRQPPPTATATTLPTTDRQTWRGDSGGSGRGGSRTPSTSLTSVPWSPTTTEIPATQSEQSSSRGSRRRRC